MTEDADYVCTLSEASLKVAREELKEDPNERLSQVETFRTWIKAQKHIKAPTGEIFVYVERPATLLLAWIKQPEHIKAPTDTMFLLKFLRTAKFSQLRAREVLEGNLKAKGQFPDWLNDIDMGSPEIQEFLATGYIYILPKRSPKGRLYIFLDPGALTFDRKWDRTVVIRTIFGLTYFFTMNENDLVNGLDFFQDFTNMSMKLMTFFGMETIRKITKLWQGTFPGRFKEFHYYNPGPIFESLMTISRPVLKKKFLDRMHVHGQNMEDVYKQIPMECFPDEYLPDDYKGPSQGPIKNLIENLCETLKSPKMRNRILHETSSEWLYDLTLKPNDVPSESFRKLNVE